MDIHFWTKRKIVCVEDFQVLDLRDIREESLRLGTRLTSEADPDYSWRIEETYQHPGELCLAYRGRIRLVRTSQGHLRFHCPCGRQVLLLCGLGCNWGKWACRQCRGAKYSLQRGTGLEHWRTKCAGIMRRLGQSQGDFFDPLPKRMPHMKPERYHELLTELGEARMEFDKNWALQGEEVLRNEATCLEISPF